MIVMMVVVVVWCDDGVVHVANDGSDDGDGDSELDSEDNAG